MIFFLLNTKGEKYKAHDTLFSVFSMCSDERANGKQEQSGVCNGSSLRDFPI